MARKCFDIMYIRMNMPREESDDHTPIRFYFFRFIRRSNGKWTYAVVKSLEETEEGKSAIRFTVDDRNASKSYAKKYWGTHVRPLVGTKLKTTSRQSEKVSFIEAREGRAYQREQDGDVSNNNASIESSGEFGRGISCPPTQSRLSFELPTRLGRNRSRSRQRSVSFSPMRTLTSIAESDDEADHEDDQFAQRTHFSAARYSMSGKLASFKNSAVKN